MQLLVFFLVLPYLIIVLLNPLFVLSISLVFVVFKTSVVGLQLDVLLLPIDVSMKILAYIVMSRSWRRMTMTLSSMF